MKIADINNPVRSNWLTEQSYRLDASPYLSGAYEARKLLERIPRTESLDRLTRDKNGIFHAGRVSRRWVTDPDHGTPFFSSTDIMEADYSYLPLVSNKQVVENSRLAIRKGWTLITRSGTVGRMAYGRPDLDGYAASEHILRVVADESRIKSGYLFAFLCSRFGVPIITSQAAGSIIQHIEPHHLTGLPVPRLGDDIEGAIHELIEEAAELRGRFQARVAEATRDLLTSAGLPELLDLQWHDRREVAFEVPRLGPTTLRALNFSPRARRILDALGSVPHRTLGEICEGGQLSRGNRFTRVDSAPGHGYRLIGQRQAPWLRPEGRWIALKPAELAMVRAADESILVASRGTLGERSLLPIDLCDREMAAGICLLRRLSPDRFGSSGLSRRLPLRAPPLRGYVPRLSLNEHWQQAAGHS